MKCLIENIVVDKNTVAPKRILVRLQRMVRRSQVQIDVMPSLEKIQNYCKYQRIEAGKIFSYDNF